MRNYLLCLLMFFICMGSCTVAFGEVPKARFTVSGFAVEGENPLTQEETRGILDPFLGEHEGLDGIEKASRALQERLYTKGYTFHRVIVPPQKSTDGVIRLQIITFKIDKVKIEGNQYYSEENILASMPFLEPGWIPNTREISRGLLVANEHPTKELAVFIRESETPGSVDARIEARDTRPHQVFSSLSNTGNDETGDFRLSAGYQNSNLFDRDNVLTLSYTTSPSHTSDVKQYGGHYRIPLYGMGGGLSMFYTYSEVDQGMIGDFFQVSGKGSFAGISLDCALYPLADYNHDLTIGVQDKLFENDSRFVNTPIGVDVRSRPLTVQYQGRLENKGYSLGISVELAGNLAWGSDNTREAYALSRQGADRAWKIMRYSANMDYYLPGDFMFRARLNGQQANEPLISGEQFGLGGAQSVRGFQEREVTGDGGNQLNMEIWSPYMGSGVRFLGFVDLARRYLNEPLPGYHKRDSLSSAGLGLRWQWRDNLHFSIDAAYVTDGSKSSETKSGDERVHCNLFYRF